VLLYLASMPEGFLLYPGVALMVMGFTLGALIVAGPVMLHGVRFDVHTLLYCGASVLLGFQLAVYSVALRFLMESARLLPPQPGFASWVVSQRIEHGFGAGLVLVLIGLGGLVRLLAVWRAGAFGNLDPFVTMRIAIPSSVAVTLGFQVAFGALFLSLAKWQVRSRDSAWLRGSTPSSDKATRAPGGRSA
jgi:hypothetical protein